MVEGVFLPVQLGVGSKLLCTTQPGALHELPELASAPVDTNPAETDDSNGTASVHSLATIIARAPPPTPANEVPGAGVSKLS